MSWMLQIILKHLACSTQLLSLYMFLNFFKYQIMFLLKHFDKTKKSLIFLFMPFEQKF